MHARKQNIARKILTRIYQNLTTLKVERGQLPEKKEEHNLQCQNIGRYDEGEFYSQGNQRRSKLSGKCRGVA